MPLDKQILVLAEDPIVRQTKHLVLEQIGFSVISVGTVREVDYVISRSIFDLAILGRTVRENVKIEAAGVIRRKAAKTPILELCNVSPVIENADHVLRSPDPADLAAKVQEILAETKKRTP